MRLLWCWLVSLSILFRYFPYRLGLGKRPLFTDHWGEVERVFRQITRMNSRIRVRHAERCPKAHPAVYAANHTKLDDPFYVCQALQVGSNYTLRTRFVMRDDFFEGFPWNWLPFRMNEIAEMGGSYNISQSSNSIAQLKPLVDMLLAPESFVIFPGGGRSMSGFWMEAHLGDEPGSIAFFLAQAQRKNPDLAVPAVPVGRTFNPVKQVSAVIVGEPRCLAPGARREAQRAFDDALMSDIASLVEIHLLHVLCGVLYLRCRHGLAGEIAVTELADQCRAVLDGLRDRYLDPSLPGSLDRDLHGALRYLQALKSLRYTGDRVLLDPSRVLAPEPFTPRYRFSCPIPYHVHQIVHFQDLAALLEQAVLGR